MELIDRSETKVSFNSWACKEVGITQKPGSVFSVICKNDKDSIENAMKLLKRKKAKEAFFYKINRQDDQCEILMVIISQ